MQNTQISNSAKKRIQKEILRDNLSITLIDNYIYAPIKLHPILQKRAEEAGKEPALVITLKDYPWKSPEVHYFSTPVVRIYMSGTHEGIRDELQNIVGKSVCFCCTSVLCDNNWHIQTTIKKIIDEFVKFTNTKARAQEKMFCNRIQEQLFSILDVNKDSSSLKCLPVSDYKISDFL